MSSRVRCSNMILAAALALPMAVHAAPRYPYKVTVLVPFAPGQGSGVANMINDRGLACGFLASGAGFCSYRGAVTQLIPLAGDVRAIPLGLNDRGQVVGYSQDASNRRRAVIFVNGAARSLAVSSHLDSIANDINNFGQVVGGFGDVQDESLAYVESRGTVRPLGTLGGPRRVDSAIGINDRNQIVGAVSAPNTPAVSGQTVAFLYERGVMKALPTPAGHTSLAVKINLRGQVVGNTQLHNGGFETTRAVLWDKGVMKTLLDTTADARDINIWGQVVGGFLVGPGGYLYEPGKGARNLNDLIDPRSGFSIVYPQAINDLQQIVGFACKEQLCGPVLLDPVRRIRLRENGENGPAGAPMPEGDE